MDGEAKISIDITDLGATPSPRNTTSSLSKTHKRRRSLKAANNNFGNNTQKRALSRMEA